MSTNHVGTAAFGRSAERSKATSPRPPPRSDKGLIVYNFCMSSQPQKPATTNEWQIQEIHTAITEADAGDFATDAEVQVIMDKWNVDIG
jgi:hypothetical protein